MSIDLWSIKTPQNNLGIERLGGSCHISYISKNNKFELGILCPKIIVVDQNYSLDLKIIIILTYK